MTRITGVAESGNGVGRGESPKPKISVFICFCPAHLTHPTYTLCCRKATGHIAALWKSPSVSSSPCQCLQAATQAAEGLLLGNVALLMRSMPSFLAGERNYLHLSWAGKASFLLLLPISSPPPPMSFVLCQNPCVGKSWLVDRTGAPQHPWKWVRRGRTLLGWWLDFTFQAPSLTTPHAMKPLGLKWVRSATTDQAEPHRWWPEGSEIQERLLEVICSLSP